jgi:hypothetical protein
MNLGAATTSADAALVFYQLGAAFLLPLPLLLAHFAAAYPFRLGVFHSRFGAGALLLVGLGGALLFAVTPLSAVGGVVPVGGRWAPIWGPTYTFYIWPAFLGAIGYACWSFARSSQRTDAPMHARQSALIGAAFGTYAGYAGPGYLYTYITDILAGRAAPLFLGFAVAAAFATFGAVVMIGALGRSVDAGLRRPLLALMLTAMFAGIAEHTPVLGPIFTGSTSFVSLGVWRIVVAALVFYALANGEVTWISLAANRRMRWSTIAAVSVVVVVVVAALGQFLRATSFGLPAIAVSGAVVLGIAYTTRPLMTRRRDQGQDTALYQRKVEVYRASLERAISTGDLGPEETRWLRSLRESLGLGEREHQLIELMVRGGITTASPGIRLMADRYRVLRLLGQGGGGRALLAEDTKLRRQVVIKELPPDASVGGAFVGQMLEEARTIARLHHPAVVTIHEVEVEAAAPRIVMEYCAGGSLDQLIRARGKLPAEEVAAIIADVLDGLAFVHSHGVLHRDIKPSNVLLTEQGRAKLADFGAATPLAADVTVGDDPGDRWHPGTIPFMSPEQARGGRLDARSDLYAVAATAYAALTGEVPIDVRGMSEAEARAAVANAARPALVGHPEGLTLLVARGLAADPRERFASAAEMRASVVSSAAPVGLLGTAKP